MARSHIAGITALGLLVSSAALANSLDNAPSSLRHLVAGGMSRPVVVADNSVYRPTDCSGARAWSLLCPGFQLIGVNY